MVKKTMDGNEAVARVAYKLSETIAIYPITPSSPMGEMSDTLSSKEDKNIFGTIPQIEEMESEAGVAGAIHGTAATGSLATTFTCSQGLLLMIPNMYKIAGELLPVVFHVSARALAGQALSIFGDHQDVMAVRQTGFAMLSSSSVQEAQDMALISHLATLDSRVPFLHFFDGFRTSHEINKIETIEDETILKLLNTDAILEHRKRSLNPDHPTMRGTAQNPDVYFQAREAANKFYDAVPEIVQKKLDKFAKETGRQYKIYDYYGDANAEKVVIAMGSAVSCLKEIVDYLNKKGEKVGVLNVLLYRPFSLKHFLAALPKSVKKIAVLDRTKESGSAGEPLYLDVVNAVLIGELNGVKVIGGRYGLSSKEFTPAMAKAVFDELDKPNPKHGFTIGINDDVTNTSLSYDKKFNLDHDVKTAVFFGLGSDGTVGANKNSVKIIGDLDEYYAQAYFVYDSKKAGSVTESHLRFGKDKIDSSYLIGEADFIGCHQFSFLRKIDILSKLKKGGTILFNSHYSPEELWDHLPKLAQEGIIEKEAKVYTIDAYKIAEETGMGSRINTIMQVCFFALANIMDRDEAINAIKNAIKKTYAKKGDEVVQKNINAVDKSLENLHEVKYKDNVTSTIEMMQFIPDSAPEFIKKFTAKLLEGKGEELPVSAMPVDGTFPTATTKYEKRAIADKVARWVSDKCIQCGTCVFACPHSAIKAKTYDEKDLKGAPEGFDSVPLKGDKTGTKKYSLFISAKDCTGCGICLKSCPVVEALTMKNIIDVLDGEDEKFEFFEKIVSEDKGSSDNLKTVQFKEPLFEYSGACAGCGEINYLKIITQLFGDRMLAANATGCSSIYGGNLPTTPWSQNKEGKGPAWANSLFEDNAEFGFGFRMSVEKQRTMAIELLKDFSSELGDKLVNDLIDCKCSTDEEIEEQRKRVNEVKSKLANNKDFKAQNLLSLVDNMVKRSVWIIGGDGWAYDIGFGGLDHVIASGKNINILVMDTEVYSNTGGQSSKATPLGAIAKFANNGKKTFKKDLGAIARSYGNVYVAQIAVRANPAQALKAIKEAEAYNGPSLIIAYSSCIEQGIDLGKDSISQQQKAIKSGYWLLYRYNPELIAQGKNPMQLDSPAPSLEIEDYIYNENRFKQLQKLNPEKAKEYLELLRGFINDRYTRYKKESE